MKTVTRILLGLALVTPPLPALPQSAQFPSKDELEQFIAASVPPDLIVSATEIGEWTLEGELPDEVGLVRVKPDSGWAELAKKAAKKRKARLIFTRGMNCVARDAARFQLEHGGLQSDSVRRFVAARCGSVALAVTPMMIYGQASTRMSEKKLLRQFKESFRDLVKASVPAGKEQLAGFAFARRGGDFVAMLVVSEARVEISPFVPTPDSAGQIVISGRMDESAGYRIGVINQGRFGVADCWTDARVTLPEFRFTCPMSPEDETAWISIALIEPDGILARPVVQLLARRERASGRVYRRPSYTTGAKLVTEKSFEPEALALINQIRHEAGLEPLRFEPAQSGEVSRLVSAYMLSSLGRSSPRVAEVIILGLMAGWEIEGDVRKGGVAATILFGTTDVHEWVADSLVSPFSRRALLDPDARRIALGASITEDPGSIAGLAATYSMFRPDYDYSSDLRAFLARVDEVRAAKGLPPIVLLESLSVDLSAQAQDIRNGSARPMDVLGLAIDAASRTLDRSVQGLLLQGSPIELLPIPELLTQKKTLELAIGITHFNSDTFPWALYALLLVIPAPPAVAEPPARPTIRAEAPG